MVSSKSGNQKGKKRNAKDKLFPVVGIGASAGGLDAFSKFFSAMPPESGMAFILIQHLDPTHASNMVDLLRRQTKMQVDEASDGLKLEPNHVYMIPPNKNMSIADRNLILTALPDRPAVPHSIDLFFRSLSEDLKESAIGIIMSGTGSDGSIGARAIKSELGMVMVQDPEDAGYDGMPREAINAGVADFVLPAVEMPGQLIEYVQKYYGKHRKRLEPTSIDEGSLMRILSLVRARTKHDFSRYKPSTINRRIERRMNVNQIDTLDQYIKYLGKHPAEVESLVRDFLINVTSFFRDPEAFSALKKHIGDWLGSTSETQEIRVWVPGCSTGEEAYSIAMIVEEVMEEQNLYRKLQVFGSDLDEDAISIARKGDYPAAIAADVSRERLTKFFIRNDERYQVKRDLREKIIFAVQDIIADPPFTKMDIISARNLLIYFDSNLQRRLVPMFNYALNEGGLLFLGTAETVGKYTDGFEAVDRRWKIYRKKKTLNEPIYQLRERFSPHHFTELQVPSKDSSEATARPSVEQMIISSMPPLVVVDRDYQVVYTHGDTSKYLHLPEGKPEMGILGMVREELRTALASGLHEAISERKRATRQGDRIRVNGSSITVKMTFAPISGANQDGVSDQLIITFEDMPRVKRKTKKEGAGSECAEIKQELQFTKETLRSTIEELETSNEELRSANEEYQSTNEELQSTNEELETSREELQSVNEELNTVNNEHQRKIEELTGIATIFLDEDLKLRRFTPTATKIFNFIETDIGRPISDITPRIKIADLADKAAKVLDSLEPFKKTIEAGDDTVYSVRVYPYRTTNNAIAGVGLIFVDISEQEAFATALRFSQSIIDTLRHPVIVLDASFQVMSANRAFYHAFEAKKEDTEGRPFFEISERQWDIPALRRLLEDILRRNSEFEGYKVERDFPHEGKRTFMLNARRLQTADKNQQRILLAIEDVTGRNGEEAFSQQKKRRRKEG
jgi:two-component system CheB/CheR fusion protein